MVVNRCFILLSTGVVSALEDVLGNNNYQKPEIFNTDQGS